MTAFLGAMLAAGILLVMSPWVWPPRSRTPPEPLAHSKAGRLLDEAGFAHADRRVLFASTAAAGLLAAAGAWLIVPVPVVSVLAGVVGTLAPTAWLRGRRQKRRRARRGMWPDVCDLLVASVRSGMSLTVAVSSLSLSAPEVLRPAFRSFTADMDASGHFDTSMLRMKATLADPASDRIVETLRMARQVGGIELVPILRALSTSIRADAALRSEIEARQSWTRGAAVLGVVAPWVVLTLLASRPEAASAYSSPEGIMLVVLGAVASVIAFQLMLRIGQLPDERRWLA
ncbi:tight adherence protein B [Microbacterium endophyticum]|uniref:Tight adherence protein B n=1 Tax=Microbacterium endophyticum TaxID=1526412 RepID=A0A7W4YKS7_9MICO|nr:type II secretion system F family protein [Microbacterium endophyticum]MBB2974725.1 tight adherence protein B [Microbacterium endophyticum]NIK37022.1 tight adherence protein B [Microbacterium endophyticum]